MPYAARGSVSCDGSKQKTAKAQDLQVVTQRGYRHQRLTGRSPRFSVLALTHRLSSNGVEITLLVRVSSTTIGRVRFAGKSVYRYFIGEMSG